MFQNQNIDKNVHTTYAGSMRILDLDELDIKPTADCLLVVNTTFYLLTVSYYEKLTSNGAANVDKLQRIHK